MKALVLAAAALLMRQMTHAKKTIAAVCFALLVSSGLVIPAAAGPLEDAKTAYKRGDYVTALLLLRPLADQRDPIAQLLLGSMYALGHGVPQDDVQAARWYQKAADQGDAGGQTALGLMYALGYGVPEDKAEAIRWFRKAADQGDAGGQLQLGHMYNGGFGVPRDYVQAARWYQKAADQGLPPAELSLGGMFEMGRGVPQDYVQAHKWYNLAVANFTPEAVGRDFAVKARDQIAAKMTPAQVAEAQRLARDWKLK